MDLCYKCRIQEGFRPRDEGAHTARIKECEECGEKKAILPSRHWIPALPPAPEQEEG